MTKASMCEQLNSISSSIPKEKPKQTMSKPKSFHHLPHPSNWIQDGEDHINISPIAQTDLGRTLHPNSMLPFTHDVFGHFASISSFWDFMEIGAKDDRIRGMGTAERMTYLKRVKKIKVDHLMYFVLDAIWQRVSSYAKLSDHVRSSELPFDIYYFNGEFNYPVRRNGMIWMIRGFEAVRTALQTEQEPDFSGLMDGLTREQLFTHYLDTHVRNRVPEVGTKVRSERNDLLKELQSSVEAPKAFRRKIKPIFPGNKKAPPEVESKQIEESIQNPQDMIVMFNTEESAKPSSTFRSEPEADIISISNSAPTCDGAAFTDIEHVVLFEVNSSGNDSVEVIDEPTQIDVS